MAALAAACSGAGERDDQEASGLRPLRPPDCEPAPAEPGDGTSGWRFTDVTAELGIEGKHWQSAAYGNADGEVVSREQENRRRREGPATMTAGVSISNADGDAYEDVFLTRVGFPNQLYQNHCGETFRDVAPSVGLADDVASAASAWGDVTGDGHVDLLVTSIMNSPNRLFVNQGDGTFVEEGEARGVGLREDVNPTFNLSYGGTLGDIDRDGDLDIVISQWQLPAQEFIRGRSRVLLNDGRGRFHDATEDLALDLRDVAAFVTTIEDVDGDGLVDLLMSADWGTSRLFRGNPDGTFRDATADSGVGTDENGMGSAVADVDGDGDLDWFVTSIFGQGCAPDVEFGCTGNRLYLNDGAGRFVDATDAYGLRSGGWGWGTAVADFDNDGRVDVAMTNGAQGEHSYNGAESDRYAVYLDDPMRLWVGDDEPPYEERAAELGLADTGLGKSLVAFDYDRDGDLDLLIGRTGGTPLLYRNDGGNQNAWLRVLPVDPATGLPVLGARVEVQARPGGPVAVRAVRAGDTYGGSPSPWAHIGLGDHDGPVHEVRITWPGQGAPTVIEDVDPRRHIVVDRDGIRETDPGTAP